MMSVTQESVKSAFCMQILEFAGLRENFHIVFVISCHFGGHFCLNSYFIFIFLL